MNWYSVFYWLTVSDGVKSFFNVTSNIFTWFAVLSFLALIGVTIGKMVAASENNCKNDEEEKVDSDVRVLIKARIYVRNFFYVMLGLSLITWLGWVTTPTKKDCIMIIAGGTVGNFLQSDSNARQLPADVMKLAHVALLSWQEQIKDISPEDRKVLGIQSAEEKKKEDFLDKLGTLTKDEIIEQFRKDSTLKIK
jgi:hypothetical protein